jgi:hypothetical protein
MEKHDVNHLETQIKELRGNLAKLADDRDLQQFLVAIHHPGFTTPAEFLLFRGVVDAMLAQTKAVSGLMQVLTSAAAKLSLILSLCRLSRRPVGHPRSRSRRRRASARARSALPCPKHASGPSLAFVYSQDSW